MKVTVTFGATAVVVPCKGEWTVGELIDQANQRYRKILEKNGEDFLVRTHHVEYCDGGILDLDDLVTDLVEDRDKLVAVFETQELQRGATVSPAGSGGGSTGHSSPYPELDPYERQLSYFQPTRGGEIEVNASTLKANTPLLVRSSSDSALAPPLEILTPPPDDLNTRPAETDANHTLTHRGEPKDRLRLDIPTTAKMSGVTLSPLTQTVELSGETGPLGIHVVPFCSSLSGRTLGLHIKSIEANSRSKREGIFREDECIVQINGTELMDKTFAQSQEVFRQAMSSPLVRLEVLPLANKQRYEKRLIGQLFTDGHDSIPKAKSPLMIHRKMDVKPETVKPEQINPKLEPRRPDLYVLHSKTPDLPASLTPQGEHQTGHVPEERPLSVSPAPVVRDREGVSPTAMGGSESPLPRGKSPTGLANLTNQKGGRKLKIDLKKGTEGLGFTVVTRDSAVHGPGPILIKNILPRGAAIKDGRLQPGDRILEVNGVDMTDRTQEELVAILRSTKQGECVSMAVARQEEIFLPRELKGEEASPLVLEDGREQLMFEVPLNDTGSAGLGISLKGNKSREKGEDLGIFIKSIIHGGAAYKDGRLRVNDQLIAVNGEALLGRSNHIAMETLRHSMSLEGNARGTIQLVLLRPAPSPGSAHNTTANAQESPEAANPQSHQVPDGPSGPRAPAGALESHHHSNGPSPQPPSQPPMVPNNIYYSFKAPPTNGDHAHYKEEEEIEEDFLRPPSPGAMEEMNAKLQYTTHPHRSGWNKGHYIPEGTLHPDTQTAQQPRQTDNPQTRNSKSMDLVADESNMRSLAEPRPESSSRGSDMGPTLGLWKSCSLESLQSAVSEAWQMSRQSQVPFHRPKPHMVRGRGCNQSFRVAIDKSYNGPSEPEDDDLSEQSSGRDTPASGSSRQDQIESEEGKKKKKKKKKNNKGMKNKEKEKKKTEDSEDQEKKAKKKGFGLLRFGKKKEEKNKAEVKAAKEKLEALNEEDLDKIERVRHELRYMEVREGHVTPEPLPPDLEDDDHDPNYARINTFREPPKGPSPSYQSRTPSPQRALEGPPPAGPSHSRKPLAEDLEGLYAKVNKQRAPPSTSTSQLQPPPSDSERVQKLRRELQQARAAPAYEELEVTRRRALDYDPPRMAVRGPDTRPAPRYEDVERQYAAHSRRADPNNYPSQSRTAPGYPGRDKYYPPRKAQPHSSSLPLATAPPGPLQRDPRYYPSLPHQATQRQDVPPTQGTRAPRYETVGRGGYRDASPGRFVSPERYGRGYKDGRQPDPRQKNALIGAV